MSVGFGLIPVLAVHKYGPASVAVSETVCPLHMIVLLGTISTVNAGAIETVATACAVHVAIPDTTVYEVVTPGTTVIEDVVAPLDHVKGPLPDADKVVFAPKQIVVFVGVTFTEELVITDTVATAAAVQVLAPDNTE